MEIRPADDWRAFVQQHAHHTQESLRAEGEKYFNGANSGDPMAVAYIQVTNGADTFVLRRSRKSIEEPLEYDLLPGRIVGSGAALEVQENAIKKEMQRHFDWTPARAPDEERIDLVLGLFKDLVNGVDPQSVTISYFLPAELQALRRFVESHREGSDVMTLRVQRRFRVEVSAG